MRTPKTDPVDHHRTSRQHAGESLTHAANAPGLASTALAVVALVIGLYAFATGHLLVGSVVVLLAAVSGAAGVAWLLQTHRKVRAAEVRWQAMNSDEPAPPPSS
ncbi:MnhB domain-containing protein [Mycobacterium sp. E796]|uniref:MnhB domain-containing protein n=1 Tax=Mycobacterium sp. E796 TaxID=1834151 RepID=UPI0008002853|nr:MnhB domain-containing protein [Mycobacterium sp. E796]OBI62181.1 hypothetical protein A5706_16855 [Mycobacterium sp. E796]